MFLSEIACLVLLAFPVKNFTTIKLQRPKDCDFFSAAYAKYNLFFFALHSAKLLGGKN